MPKGGAFFRLRLLLPDLAIAHRGEEVLIGLGLRHAGEQSSLASSATPPDVSRRAPLLGEHTDEVLSEAGFSSSEISALRQSGAVR